MADGSNRHAVACDCDCAVDAERLGPKYTNATFVVEPTGSKGNACGDSRQLVHPRSGITVRVAIYYWQDWHPMDTRDAIRPRILAALMFDAYRHNTDPALVAIEGVRVAEGRR